MSFRKKYFLVFCFVLFDMFLLIGFLVIRDKTMLNDLTNEVHELQKLDITKDRYNRPIKSRGNYAIVEKAIKEYLDEYAVGLQDVMAVMNDPQLTKVLSYDNYISDGPEFKESLEYISTTKVEFNDKINVLIYNLKEENIKDYINGKVDDPYYINLYNELMLDDEMMNDFDEARSLLEKIKLKVNNVFDTSSKVLNFLIINKNKWKVEDGQIKFLSVDLYNQYNTLISGVKTN